MSAGQKNRTRYKSFNVINDDPRVDYVYRDSDGIWLELNYGWRNTYDEPIGALHGIHEDRVADVLRKLSGIAPCDCEDCTEGLTRNEREGH
jgi:hypothetical protein